MHMDIEMYTVMVCVFQLSLYLSNQCTYFRDFHGEIFVPMFGFESIQQMFLEGSPHLRVGDINIPVVALNAADDPFCPESGTAPRKDSVSIRRKNES